MNTDLIEEYAARIEPLLSEAKKAYGKRDQDTPAHAASREYTRLLTEFHERGGSLPMLAKRIGVAYAGIRRRVVMRDTYVTLQKPKIRVKGQDVPAAAQRVLAAKEQGINAYHDQLAFEYSSGISFSNLAKELKLSSAAPLYYGVQRSIQRKMSEV